MKEERNTKPMKNTIRVSMILAAFAGIFTFSSPNYANPFVSNPVLGIHPETVSKLLKGRLELQSPPLLFKKKKTAADPYAQALKVARLYSTSA